MNSVVKHFEIIKCNLYVINNLSHTNITRRCGLKEGSREHSFLLMLPHSSIINIFSDSQFNSLESTEALRRYTCLGPTLTVSELTGLKLTLRINCCPSSPGDSNIQPKLRTIKLEEE